MKTVEQFDYSTYLDNIKSKNKCDLFIGKEITASIALNFLTMLIKENMPLTYLTIKGFRNAEANETANLLAELIPTLNSSLQVLDVSDNQWGDDGFLRFAHTLADCKALRGLMLAENNLSQRAANTLMVLLPHLMLDVLIVGGNNFNADDASNILRHLPPACSLTALSFSGNPLGNEGLHEIIRRFDISLQKIGNLYVANCGITDEGIKSATRVLQNYTNHTCMHFDLKDNQITDITLLIEFIRKFPALRKLDLGNNYFDATTIVKLNDELLKLNILPDLRKSLQRFLDNFQAKQSSVDQLLKLCLSLINYGYKLRFDITDTNLASNNQLALNIEQPVKITKAPLLVNILQELKRLLKSALFEVKPLVAREITQIEIEQNKLLIQANNSIPVKETIERLWQAVLKGKILGIEIPAIKLLLVNASTFFTMKAPRHVDIHMTMKQRFEILPLLSRDQVIELYTQTGVFFKVPEDSEKMTSLIGKGEFGELYIGKDHAEDEYICVKKIASAAIDDSKHERLVHEKLQKSGLPNIMPLYFSDVTEDEARMPCIYQYMALAGFGNGAEFAKSLAHITDTALKWQLLYQVTYQLLTGIAGMHAQYIYHLDIKPQNFVLTNAGFLYVIDFGCAKALTQLQSAIISDGGIGDVRYFSPERVAHFRFLFERAGYKVNPTISKCEQYAADKADAWAVGITLFEMMSTSFPLNHLITTQEGRLNHCDEKYFSRQLAKAWHHLQNDSDMKHPASIPFIKLLKKLLLIDPNQRLSVLDALQENLFKDFAFLSEEKAKAIFMELKKGTLKWPAPTEERERLYAKTPTVEEGSTSHQRLMSRC